MQTFLHDFRCGFRMLLKSPVFTAVAVFSLALGIGANTAIFTLIDAILLRWVFSLRSDGSLIRQTTKRKERIRMRC